eukprot:GGOE01008334.1.p1 GENE.GGOE01008334.1~~GGOE01008334.1.p1  ORF type:complete len:175 (-),score=36.23 GGOE01008334.1:743-1267(-)
MGCVCVVAYNDGAVAPLQPLNAPDELANATEDTEDSDEELEYFRDDSSTITRSSTQDPIDNLSFSSQTPSSSASSTRGKYTFKFTPANRVRVQGRRVVASREPSQPSHTRLRLYALSNPPRRDPQLCAGENSKEALGGTRMALDRVMQHSSPQAVGQQSTKVSLHFKLKSPRDL